MADLGFKIHISAHLSLRHRSRGQTHARHHRKISTAASERALMSALGHSLPKCDVRYRSVLPPIATGQQTSWEVSSKTSLLSFHHLVVTRELGRGTDRVRSRLQQNAAWQKINLQRVWSKA